MKNSSRAYVILTQVKEDNLILNQSLNDLLS